MMNVITSEFYKIFRSKIFSAVSIILLAINTISFGAIAFVQNSGHFSSEIKAQMTETGISNYQSSYEDFIFYIILVFAICLIAAEYENGSIRQLACHGIARWKLVLGQYIAISVVITMILLAFGILNLLSGTILFKLGEVDIYEFIRMNFGIILMFWGITGIGTFFSYLIKNSGIAIIVSSIFIISGKYVMGMLSSLTKDNIFIKYSLTNMRKIIINFNSKPEDVLWFSTVFLLIGIITVLGSILLFTKRDVD